VRPSRLLTMYASNNIYSIAKKSRLTSAEDRVGELNGILPLPERNEVY
jgi:hypothetical protein